MLCSTCQHACLYRRRKFRKCVSSRQCCEKFLIFSSSGVAPRNAAPGIRPISSDSRISTPSAAAIVRTRSYMFFRGISSQSVRFIETCAIFLPLTCSMTPIARTCFKPPFFSRMREAIRHARARSPLFRLMLKATSGFLAPQLSLRPAH